MPIDRGAIDAQLRDIGEGERWWDQREFRDLPHVLNSDERIHGLIVGKLGRRRPRILRAPRWLVVVTDQRMIFLQQQRFGRKQIDVRFAQVTRIQHGSGIRSYRITLETRERKYRLRIPKTDAFRFVRALEPFMPQRPVAALAAAFDPGGTTPPPLPLPPGEPGQPAEPGRAVQPRQFVPPRSEAMGVLASLPGLPGLAARAAIRAFSDFVTHGELARVEAKVERLEGDLEKLRYQVEFLETLLQQQSAGMVPVTVSVPSDNS